MNRQSISRGNLRTTLRTLFTVWRERANIRSILESGNYRFLKYVPPGHFYSPIPDIRETLAKADIVFDRSVLELPSICLRLEAQLDLARQFVKYYADIPFPERRKDGCRYYLDNGYFSYGDAVTLYSMMRQFQPRRIVEIGSGFSSAAMLDVSQRFYDHQIAFTFIEPYPERLMSLLTDVDRGRCEIVKRPVQEVSSQVFATLDENDFLFVDSSHVAKTHSDVLHIVFSILPVLKAGVLVHFHDVLWPFEYPQMWIDDGRAWNEAYFIRAFLQYNSAFQILYFNSMLEIHHAEFLSKEMPLAVKTPSLRESQSNTSLWIRKTSD